MCVQDFVTGNLKVLLCIMECLIMNLRRPTAFIFLVFHLQVGQGYPHDPPKVKCETMVYHPNIDLEGNVCLNILRYRGCSAVLSPIFHLLLYIVFLQLSVNFSKIIT